MSATPVGNMLTDSSPPAGRTLAGLGDGLRELLGRSVAQVNTLVLGKPQEVRLAFVALLSEGHLLIEDLPGLGKTTLAHALAANLFQTEFLDQFGHFCLARARIAKTRF